MKIGFATFWAVTTNNNSNLLSLKTSRNEVNLKSPYFFKYCYYGFELDLSIFLSINLNTVVLL